MADSGGRAQQLWGRIAFAAMLLIWGPQVFAQTVYVYGPRIPITFYHDLGQEQTYEEQAMMMDILAFSDLSPEQLAAAVHLTPCGNNPVLTQATKSLTSHEEELTLRQVAGTNIIDAVFGARSVALNNREISVMYSDGGTEVFVYRTASSLHTIKANSRVLGTGVAGSACQGTS